MHKVFHGKYVNSSLITTRAKETITRWERHAATHNLLPVHFFAQVDQNFKHF